MKLLIVDDCEDILNILFSFLELSGHAIDKALNGIEAAMLLQQESYDVVITDATMPDMSGVELCRFIKSRFPATYIIGISGSLHALDELKAAGADICFTKPFHIDELEKAIKNKPRTLSINTDIMSKGSDFYSLTGHLAPTANPTEKNFFTTNQVVSGYADCKADTRPSKRFWFKIAHLQGRQKSKKQL